MAASLTDSAPDELVLQPGVGALAQQIGDKCDGFLVVTPPARIAPPSGGITSLSSADIFPLGRHYQSIFLGVLRRSNTYQPILEEIRKKAAKKDLDHVSGEKKAATTTP